MSGPKPDFETSDKEELVRFLSNPANAEKIAAFQVRDRKNYFATVATNGIVLLHCSKDRRAIPLDLRDISFPTLTRIYDITGQAKLREAHQHGWEFQFSDSSQDHTEESAINNLKAHLDRYKVHGVPSEEAYSQFRGTMFGGRKTAPAAAVDVQQDASVKLQRR